MSSDRNRLGTPDHPAAGERVRSTPVLVPGYPAPRGGGHGEAENGDAPAGAVGLDSIIGTSEALRDALARARKVAASRLSTMLIIGETGTGKELFARGIHYASPTRGDPFVAVNCAAIPEALLESELFGHERGAFPDAHSEKPGLLELARAGTLFLDEIGELPRRLQPKLLRALEERRVRRLGGLEEVVIECRIIAASNPSLADAVKRLDFREDLYYRLNVFRITLPPLRDRVGDAELLAQHFLEEFARQQGQPPKRLDEAALAALATHTWPGNVRELKNVIEHAAVLSEADVIGAEHLMLQKRMSLAASSEGGPIRDIRIPPEGKALDAIEKEAVTLTLEITRGNRSAAARILGISRPTLARKMREYAIDVPSGRRDG